MMEPGRELDALVAEKVMGCKLIPCAQCGNSHLNLNIENGCHWSPSTSIEAAWQVVERFRRGDIKAEIEALMVAACVELEITDYPEPDGDCLCRIYSPTCAKVEARAHEMPLAICLAALKAVGYDVEK